MGVHRNLIGPIQVALKACQYQLCFPRVSSILDIPSNLIFYGIENEGKRVRALDCSRCVRCLRILCLKMNQV